MDWILEGYDTIVYRISRKNLKTLSAAIFWHQSRSRESEP
jgi:hypothetical protein